jgi:hypothetical protein
VLMNELHEEMLRIKTSIENTEYELLKIGAKLSGMRILMSDAHAMLEKLEEEFSNKGGEND